jgi:hypothetical protein
VAKSAVTEFTDHIETVRQKAYNEGYAAAIRAVVEFSGSGTAKPKATRAKTTTVKATTAKPSTAKATTVKATTVKATTVKATTAKATTAKPVTASQAVPGRQRRAQAKPTSRPTRRGDNARYIAEAMMVLPDHSGPAAAIKKVLAGKGHDLPYTSIRHALGQLQARGEVSVAADGRTWSHVTPQP